MASIRTNCCVIPTEWDAVSMSFTKAFLLEFRNVSQLPEMRVCFRMSIVFLTFNDMDEDVRNTDMREGKTSTGVYAEGREEKVRYPAF